MGCCHLGYRLCVCSGAPGRGTTGDPRQWLNLWMKVYRIAPRFCYGLSELHARMSLITFYVTLVKYAWLHKTWIVSVHHYHNWDSVASWHFLYLTPTGPYPTPVMLLASGFPRTLVPWPQESRSSFCDYGLVSCGSYICKINMHVWRAVDEHKACVYALWQRDTCLWTCHTEPRAVC